jgi:hypothetical protein
MTQFLQLVDQELADLPNPYYADPEPFFVWRADDVLKEVEILPNPAHQRAARVYQAIKDCYGLNRKELKGLRYQIYKMFEVLKLAGRQPLPAPLAHQIQTQVQTMMADNAPFAGMIRYFNASL